VTGTGFSPSSIATVTYILSQGALGSFAIVVATVDIDSGGAFSANFEVPSSQFAGKRHLIHAVDRAGTVATVEHVLPPAEIQLSPASGTIGAVISISGTGFPINVRPSSLSFLGADLPLPGFLDTNRLGEIKIDVQLPELLPAGAGQMTLTIGSTAASAPFEKIPATLTVSRDTEFILLSGTGFPRNTFVSSTTINGQKIFGGAVFTDDSGEFGIRIPDPQTTRVEIAVIVANTTVSVFDP